MYFFALAQDYTLDREGDPRRFLGVADVQAPPVDRLYLAVGDEVRQLSEALNPAGINPLPEWRVEQGAVPASDLPTQQPGLLHFVHESALLGWAPFPARLGRISSRLAGAGLHLHQEAAPLAAQLQALRAKKPLQQHFRIAFVNGFGGNLGDCTMGATALRAIMEHLRQHLPSVGCDVLFGLGGSAATAHILHNDVGVERVLYQTLAAPEFAQYDAYFDFRQMINVPLFSQLPTLDWALWCSGLAPQEVPAEQKRNCGHIHEDAWKAVQALLRHRPGQKVLFNPKASVPLRSMPEDVALRFAARLLELAPDCQWVIDQPLGIQHPRLLDLSGQIDSPEKFKALVAQVEGVITVDTFALHQSDISSTPCVTLCSSIAPSAYPYYPYNAGIGIPGYDTLPAFQRPKVSDAEWEACKTAYHAAWARLNPAQVLTLLREKMVERQAHPHPHSNEPQRLTVGPPVPSANCVVLDGTLPRLKRQRLVPEHAWASQRFAGLTEQLLKPGSVAVMACAPDAPLALTLAQRIAPHGELIVLEPRAPLARNVEAALHLAGSPCTARVLEAVSLGGAAQANINALEPWSESHSSEWGNLPAVITVPSQPVDALALARCNALLVQSPMPYELFINGALETLKRCRPLVLVAPVSRKEATAVLQAAQAAHYDFWVETALPNTQPAAAAAAASAWLLVGVPRERPVRMTGFTRLSLE